MRRWCGDISWSFGDVCFKRGACLNNPGARQQLKRNGVSSPNLGFSGARILDHTPPPRRGENPWLKHEPASKLSVLQPRCCPRSPTCIGGGRCWECLGVPRCGRTPAAIVTFNWQSGSLTSWPLAVPALILQTSHTRTRREFSREYRYLSALRQPDPLGRVAAIRNSVP